MCSLLGLCVFSISTVALSSLQQALSSGVNYWALVDMAARSMYPLPPPRWHLISPPWREWGVAQRFGFQRKRGRGAPLPSSFTD